MLEKMKPKPKSLNQRSFYLKNSIYIYKLYEYNEKFKTNCGILQYAYDSLEKSLFNTKITFFILFQPFFCIS